MIFYMIRHKASGEFMPELKKGSGYTHWNPSSIESIKGRKLIGTPRLFRSLKHANGSISRWNTQPNSRVKYVSDPYGEDVINDIKPDGRKEEDLEVIEVKIEEIRIL